MANRAASQPRHTSCLACCHAIRRWWGVVAVGGRVTSTVEAACEVWGRLAAGHPGRALALVVTVTAVACLGFLNLHTEWRHYHLWVPRDSIFAKIQAWKATHFVQESRTHVVLWRAPGGVLQAEAVREMYRLHQRVEALTVEVEGRQVTWQDVCLEVPCSLPKDANSKAMLTLQRLADALQQRPPQVPRPLREAFCEEVEAWPRRCLSNSLLDLWELDEARINNLTDQQVLQDINLTGGRATAARHLLGGVVRDSAGRVVAAASGLLLWTTKVRRTQQNLVLDPGTGQPMDLEGLRWEEALVGEVRAATVGRGEQRPLTRAAHSLGKTATEAVMKDLRWALLGGVVVVGYVLITLPRPLLVLLGLLTGVPLAVLASYGLCAALAVPFSFLNVMVPVLAAGLGIDDMYVIAAAWEDVARPAHAHQKDDDVAERGGRTLRRVGVAIALTSLTDVLAFLVGASTHLPGLRWFCLYAAAATTCVFFLQVTLFVAALALHQRRGGTSACRKTRSMERRVMARYGALLLRPAVCAAVLVVASVLLGVGVWGAAGLRRQFSLSDWFLPSSSDLYQLLVARHAQYPSQGEHAQVYFANVTLPQDLPGLWSLATALQSSPYVESVSAWFTVFQTFLPQHLTTLSSEQFREALTLFLYSPLGAPFVSDVIFVEPLRCLQPAPRLTAFKMHVRHTVLSSSEQQQAALRDVHRLVAEAKITGFRGAWADVYGEWETGEVIGGEVVRGLGMVAGAVSIVTMVMVGVGRAAALVVGCVVASLVQVVALMRVAGLPLNTITAITLVLAAGLSVDYVAHITHAFLTASGTRRQRVCAALQDVGPPVLHAGLSTLLVFAALGPSRTHLFIAYFTVLTSVAAVSLLHALVLLPVLLSLLGPHQPHHDHATVTTTDKTTPTQDNIATASTTTTTTTTTTTKLETISNQDSITPTPFISTPQIPMDKIADITPTSFSTSTPFVTDIPATPTPHTSSTPHTTPTPTRQSIHTTNNTPTHNSTSTQDTTNTQDTHTTNNTASPHTPPTPSHTPHTPAIHALQDTPNLDSRSESSTTVELT